VEFETAEFLYKKDQMAAGCIDQLFQLWAASNAQFGGQPPFWSSREMYAAIDNAPLGGIAWQSFQVHFQGERLEDERPDWMDAEYTIWYRNPLFVVRKLLANADFMGQVDLAPFRSYNSAGHRRYHDFMSGDWAWEQAVRFLNIVFFDYLFFFPSLVRISLLKIQTITAPSSSQSFLVATKPPSPL
jgi:hypothetical protein